MEELFFYQIRNAVYYLKEGGEMEEKCTLHKEGKKEN